MKKLFFEFWLSPEFLLSDGYDDSLGWRFKIKSWPEKTKRLIWNRGVKLQWNRLWVRRDEFHSSLDMDAEAMLDMSRKQRDAYIRDLCKRREIAHKRDIARA